jgi:hypothetical protein
MVGFLMFYFALFTSFYHRHALIYMGYYLKRGQGATMQEFLRVRVAIDSLIEGTKLSIQLKSVSDSMEQIGKARLLIQELKQMSRRDQAAIVAKRESTIEDLAVIAGKIKNGPSKKGNAKGKLAPPLGTA